MREPLLLSLVFTNGARAAIEGLILTHAERNEAERRAIIGPELVLMRANLKGRRVPRKEGGRVIRTK